MQSPLPVRDGVNATRLRLPDEGPWDTAMDYMMHRWGHIDPQGIEDRFDAGEIVGEGGVPLHRGTRLAGEIVGEGGVPLHRGTRL
ncbi:MAG TPA: hypothetical protein VJS86_11910, partial [Arthrobacter sp.]|nr:hypothetical protein [Arthrobacter sp.]